MTERELHASGLSPADVRWEVSVANLKAYHLTQQPGTASRHGSRWPATVTTDMQWSAPHRSTRRTRSCRLAVACRWARCNCSDPTRVFRSCACASHRRQVSCTAPGPGRPDGGYPELISDWNVLPVVLGDREQAEPSTARPVPLPAIAPKDLMSPEEVADELTTLAGVEHALCVEYLYAHYSLNAPLMPAPSADELTRRTFAAGQEISSVAVDEMRHLRWVNEALGMLGRARALTRARVIKRRTDHVVRLERLTPERLQWFVDVEAPSQTSGANPNDPGPTTIDGMYVQLHASVVNQLARFPEGDRLTHLIKLIIDEAGTTTAASGPSKNTWRASPRSSTASAGPPIRPAGRAVARPQRPVLRDGHRRAPGVFATAGQGRRRAHGTGPADDDQHPRDQPHAREPRSGPALHPAEPGRTRRRGRPCDGSRQRAACPGGRRGGLPGPRSHRLARRTGGPVDGHPASGRGR
ncbi:hypothetical protein CA983_25040 [Streptomyces swartbergensis]|uniref:Iminophenyl-pyruvate dimer synthase domain-containing protein n=1 Tax=Streptomyces swartbergensis TaxID=487165 RepID=A0A243RZD9_9ACTN|nr:hypothetical protein CA983_25040 [Streptomyces swartbergensis]